MHASRGFTVKPYETYTLDYAKQTCLSSPNQILPDLSLCWQEQICSLCFSPDGSKLFSIGRAAGLIGRGGSTPVA